MKKIKLAMVAVGGASLGFVACGPEAPPPENTAQIAGAFTDVLTAIVDGVSEGSLTMPQAVDMALGAGLVVDGGSPWEDAFLIDFVDPDTGEVLLTMSSTPEITGASSSAKDLMVGGKPDASGAVSCTYKDARFIFDASGKMFGLKPRAAGHTYRVVVSSAIGSGRDAMANGCLPWNDALPMFGEPQERATLPKPVDSAAANDPVVIVRCYEDAELATKKPSVLASASAMRWSNGISTGLIRVDCKNPYAAVPATLAQALQHECGHLLGLAHSDPKDPTDPESMKPSVLPAVVPITQATKDAVRAAWDKANTDVAVDCVKGYNAAIEIDPCGGDPCCGDPSCGDPCGGDPCCGDPCCGDPCCGDPSCGQPCGGDPCCGNPCCYDPWCCGDKECQCEDAGGILLWDNCYTCESFCAYCAANLDPICDTSDCNCSS